MQEFPFFEPQEKTVVFHFVERHRIAMGISKVNLVRRMGLININKGLRHFRDFLEGDFDQPFIVENLSTALVIDPRQLEQVIAEAKRNRVVEELKLSVHDAQHWARNFTEHAVIETELACPSPIFMAAMFDTGRLKIIELDTRRYAASYIQQAIREIPHRLDSQGNIPAFGAPTGITINIGPEMAIHHDLLGKETGRSNWVNRYRRPLFEY